MSAVLQETRSSQSPIGHKKPRLGFLGIGWIGRARMQALQESGVAEIVAIADASGDALGEAAQIVREASMHDSLDGLLQQDLDGMVIATPSGAHAAQAITALGCGLAVFCQKPLARTADETRRVIDAARRNDRLLGVDFSYRHVNGVPRLRELVLGGELGELYAIDLVFHNAYGPDKPWFYDLQQSGGGCVMDLGIHLIDLACWITGCTQARNPDAQLFARGVALAQPIREVEDYASAQWRFENGTGVRLTCSWNLPAGRDAVIGAAFYGTAGGAALRNVDGSFHDFTVERFDRTRRECLAAPPDKWGGRALVAWARRLARDPRFDEGARELIDVAAIVDAIHGR
ncbi:MAG TPA: Gfo/Idh/MocA family oxidoreductase [Rhodanobacteraceae bacterium]